MNQILKKLKSDFPEFNFLEGELPCWSPELKNIFFDPSSSSKECLFGVLHELGHARLGHNFFESDFDLLEKETLAWAEACQIATKYGIVIDESYIQECLDSYRDWVYKRSQCPECRLKGLQKGSNYKCPNCQTTWYVTTTRQGRPYRLKSKSR